MLAEGLPAQGAQPTEGALPPVSPEMGCPLLLDLEPVAPTHLGPGPYKTPEVPRPAVPSPHPQAVVVKTMAMVTSHKAEGGATT